MEELSKTNQQRRILLNEQDAAEYIGLSVAWLQRARWSNTGPNYIKVGGRNGRAVRYRQRDLDKWLDENTVTTSDTMKGVSYE